MNAAAARRVVRDREGGFIALDSVSQGQLVVLAPISPPIRTRRDRELRRRGLRLVLMFDAVLLLLAIAALLIAAVAARAVVP